MELPAPLALAFDASYVIPADSLRVDFPASPQERLSSFSGLFVELDGKLLLDGIVDEQSLRVDAAGRVCSIQARSRAALLIDNEAIPQTFYMPRLTDLYHTCIQQYGFAGLLTDRNPRLSIYTVSKGRSEWQALEGFCRQALGTRPHIVGNYLSTRQRLPARHLALSNRGGGQPYLSLLVRDNRYPVLTKLILKNPVTKLYDSAVSNPAAAGWNLKRKRYIAPPAEWGGAARAGADRMLRDSMAAKFTVRVVLPGLVSVAVGDRVTLLDDPAWRGTLAVYTLAYRLGAQGTRTELVLILPEYL